MKAVSEFNTDRHSVDPITLEVIRHGLVSITDQTGRRRFFNIRKPSRAIPRAPRHLHEPG
jgi:hypothetical protein